MSQVFTTGIVVVEQGSIEKSEISRLKRQGVIVVQVADVAKAQAFPAPPARVEANPDDGFRLDH